MAATCILLFPPSSSSTTLASIDALLTQTYPSRITGPQWSLTHAAYRAVVQPSTINGITVASAAQSDSSNPAHLHVLSLSFASNKTFIHTFTPILQSNKVSAEARKLNAAATEATIAVPKGPDTSSFSELLVRKMAPLWTAVKQLDLFVKDGQAWSVGAFEVLAGEVRSNTQATQGGKGVVVSVSLVETGLLASPSEKSEQSVNSEEEALLREFCTSLGLQLDGTEHFWGRRYATSPDREVALWCKLLRSRGLIMPSRSLGASAKR